MTLSEHDRDELRYAKRLLERPSVAARVTNLIGAPIEKGIALLPQRLSELVTGATRVALQKALDVAVATMPDAGRRPSGGRMHQVLAAVSGAGGGALGLAALPVELSISTTVMLRAIAEIARSEGEDVTSLETKLACMEVFALGGRSLGDDATDTGYFAVRTALARSVSEAVRYIAERGLVEEGAPAIVRLVAQIASRFGAVVSEKAAAQAIPVLGAAGGAVVNLVFVRHFQDMARGHFIVRRLERTHGEGLVRAEYERLTV